MFNRMRDLLALAYISRWNVVPLTKGQSVAEHCYRVAVIALELCERLQLDNRAAAAWDIGRVLRWSLVHDGPECLTGDLPSQFKRIMERIGKLDLDGLWEELCPWYPAEQGITTVPEELIVKVADTLEAISWLHAHGTPASLRILHSLEDRVRDMAQEGCVLQGMGTLPEIVRDLIKELKSGDLPMVVDGGKVTRTLGAIARANTNSNSDSAQTPQPTFGHGAGRHP
jgi:5'-deoxynucleotidase YfbR-like HD superfamily hydrolase